MYFDEKLMDVEYLCCLAHAKAKLKYAYDQGYLQDRIFLEMIAVLYHIEKLGTEDVYRRKNAR